MKVTYTQNRFEIDGVPVINPEVLGFLKDHKGAFHKEARNGTCIEDGDSFSLPDNIIAEKKYRSPLNTLHDFCFDGEIPVYRLKLKEPIEYDLYQPVEGGVKGTHISTKEPLVEVSGSTENRLRSRIERELLVDTGSKEITLEEIESAFLEYYRGSETTSRERLAFKWILQNFTITRK